MRRRSPPGCENWPPRPMPCTGRGFAAGFPEPVIAATGRARAIAFLIRNATPRRSPSAATAVGGAGRPDAGDLLPGFSRLAIGAFVGFDPVDAAQPAAEIDVAAALGTERAVLPRRGL